MIKLLLLSLLVFPLAGCFEKRADSINLLTVEKSNGETHQFKVELALTVEQKTQGLMNREHMDEDAGMLFYFDDEAERRFWMKNTLIPLDMIFIRSDGIIHYIHQNAVPHDLTGISSQGNARAVLELNGGVTAKLGIQAGDRVLHPYFQDKKAQ